MTTTTSDTAASPWRRLEVFAFVLAITEVNIYLAM
jgi:hypothetical protein